MESGLFLNNENAKKRIDALFQSGRIPHGILLRGGDEELRKDCAKYMAMKFQCISQNPPCGKCGQCIKVMSDCHSDVITAKGSGKTGIISIEEIRRISADSVIKANEGKYKVYFLFDVDKKLMREGQNAFLKTLEEPPEKVVFIMTCESEKSLLDTIRSRVTLLSLDSKEEVSGEILETAENIVLSILENREFPLMKSLAPIIGDRAKAKEILLQVKEILRKSLSQCFMVETGSQTAEKASLKLNKLKILKLMEATDNALIYIDQNGDMNLLSACLCGKYRRIAWQK